MPLDCTGNHECGPPFPMPDLGDRWECPDCQRQWEVAEIGDAAMRLTGISPTDHAWTSRGQVAS